MKQNKSNAAMIAVICMVIIAAFTVARIIS